MILRSAFACYTYFLSLDNEGPEAGEHDSNSPAPYLEQDYRYVQLLGNQESTRSKRTLSLSHKQRMLALRHQVHSRGYAGRQSALLVYMVFALTQTINWNQIYTCWGYVGANTHSDFAIHWTISSTFISPWSNEYPELSSNTVLNLCNINTLHAFVLSCDHIRIHNTMSKEMWQAYQGFCTIQIYLPPTMYYLLLPTIYYLLYTTIYYHLPLPTTTYQHLPPTTFTKETNAAKEF